MTACYSRIPMTETQSHAWLLLAFQLPAQPGYLRVKLWRRLQDVGALSFRNSLWVLPAAESAAEDFEWILREVRAGGGEGAVFESTLAAGTSDAQMRELFDAEREADYQALAEELRTIETSAERRRSRRLPAEVVGRLGRLRRRLTEIEEIDFFAAGGRKQVHALLQRLEARVADEPQEAPTMSAPAPELRARTWVTRAHVQVDRMASAWLIRRWIDPQASFKFVAGRDYAPAKGELRFDMFEAEYTHDADRCTFEVLLDVVQPPDDALRAIGEIVHDLDLKDRKFEREETAGVRQMLAGITAGHERDEDRLARASVLFDELYTAFAARK
jgi:hypothetical protein